MTIRHITTYLLMAIAVLMTGCGNELEDNRLLSNGSATTLIAQFEGEWKVGNHNIGKGKVDVYASGFSFSNIPYGDILSKVMSQRTVECDANDNYVVPYDNIGYSQHAIYMKLGASQWLTEATIDGQRYYVRLCMAQPSGQQTAYPNATYSKVSGVYSMVFPAWIYSFLFFYQDNY